MQQLAYLLKISRPRFWIYVLGPYIVGSVAAISAPEQLFSPIWLIFAIYFTFPANLLIYGINDIFDYETDVLNQKKTGYEAVVTPDRRRFLAVWILITNVPFLAAAFLTGTYATDALTTFFFLSVFYSAKPIRAKTKPVLDSLFNLLYAAPGFFAFYLLGGGYIPWSVYFAAWAWTFAMHAYSAVPDISADRAAGFSTVATFHGGRLTLAICLMLYVISAILTYQYLGFFAIAAAVVYTVLIALSLFKYSEERVFAVYKFFPYINAIVGFCLFWTIALKKFY